MFNKKRIKRLEETVGNLGGDVQKLWWEHEEAIQRQQRQIKKFEINIKQLTCEHKNVEYLVENDCGYYSEECLDCNKTVREFSSELELREAEVAKKLSVSMLAQRIVDKLKKEK